MTEPAVDCAACGAALAGPFCHACGERRPRPEDDRLGAFLRDQFHEVTSADGRLWRTLRALFVPGKLTEEYFAGRRGQYVRPVRIFLVVNVAFFFWLTFMGGQAFRGDAALYRTEPGYHMTMTRAAAEAGVADAAYDAAFAQHADTLSRSLVILFVPLFTVVLGVLLAPVRRPLLRHLVLSTHFVAVLMASTVVVGMALLGVALLGQVVTGRLLFQTSDAVVVPVLVVAWAAYLVGAVRRVYGVPWWAAATAGTLAATVGTLLMMRAYRWALFYVTLWTLDVPA